MVQSATNDIIKWTESLSSWKQDALRRLACSSELTDSDRVELLLLAKNQAGFDCSDSESPVAVPLDKSHISAPSGTNDVRIKAIQNIQSVNQLTPSASLEFQPNKLTVIYGRNGSGKSGFVRILRSACRTRLTNDKDIKILQDVYGGSDTPQSAEIVIVNSSGAQTLNWSAATSSHEDLQHIAVFDSKSAQLYIDAGNQIQFLPFGLDLPEKFNNLCSVLKTSLETENKALVQDLAVKSVTFSDLRDSPSQSFYTNLNANTSDQNIETACEISDEDKQNHQDISEGLIAGQHAIQNHKSLASFTKMLANECKILTDGLSDAAILSATNAVRDAKAARAAADLAAQDGLGEKPEQLGGVMSEPWQLMWKAAKKYSVEHAYPGMNFPVLENDPNVAACVLCQQALEPAAIIRLKRFQGFMENTLKTQADNKMGVVSQIHSNLPSLGIFSASGFEEKTAGLKNKHTGVYESLETFKANILIRHQLMSNLLSRLEEPKGEIIPLPKIEEKLRKISTSEEKHAEDLGNANNPEEKARLVKRRDNLADRILLAKNKTIITARRELLKNKLYIPSSLKNLTRQA